MSVAVYAIFKDEAAHVARWAETTGEADVRVVVDTGSTDDTVEECRRHGLDVTRAAIAPFRFDDARNLALALVPASVDWCLQLDADETLNDDWRGAFDAVADPHIARYAYRWENHGAAAWGLVMRSNLHARHGLRWRYPCHEVLVPSGVPTITVAGMVVEHHPDETKPRDGYLHLLERGVAEEPGDHRMAFYHGRELYYRGRWDDARTELTRFLALPGGWPPERGEAYRLLARMDDFPERWLWKAVAEAPERREPYCDLARLYSRQGDSDAARAALLLASRRDDESVYTTERDCWGVDFDMLAIEIDAGTADVE